MSNVSKLLRTTLLDVTNQEHRQMFETAMILDTFDKLVKAAHDNSKSKGFWGGLHSSVLPEKEGTPCSSPNTGEKLMLMVSELAEAFEAHRKGTEDQPCDKPINVIDPMGSVQKTCPQCDGKGWIPDPTSTGIANIANDVICRHCDRGIATVTGVRRLTNMEEEMADTVIRVMDWCGYKGIDLGRCVLAKMEFNRSRPHMHGRKC